MSEKEQENTPPSDSRNAVQDLRDAPRKNVRHSFTLSHFSFGDRECMTRDLSLSGAFVEGDFSEVKPGDTIDIEFKSSGEVAEKYKFSSSVARVTPEGLGLRFLSLGMDTYGALLDLTLKA